MKAIVIESNHGNHIGFSRKWNILHKDTSKMRADKYLRKHLKDIEDDGLSLTYRYVVSQKDYDNGIFDGGHYGYAPNEVVTFFEN